MNRQSSYNFEEVMEMARGKIFGPGNPQLPLPNMLMIDRIAKISADGGAYGRGQVIAEMDVRPDMWFFKCHFEGDPVMPGCLGLDALWQLVGVFLGWSGQPGRGRALGVDEVKFFGQILPDAKLVTYRVDIRRLFKLKLALAVGDGSVSVDGREIYTAKNLRVGLMGGGDELAA